MAVLTDWAVMLALTRSADRGVKVRIYLDGAQLAERDPAKVSLTSPRLSWFGAFRHHGTTGPNKETLRFDVTDQLRELGGTANTSGSTVTIEATQRRVPAYPSMAPGMQADAADAFRPQAKPQIGAIELRQATAPPVPQTHTSPTPP
jgi:hypothetical protein